MSLEKIELGSDITIRKANENETVTSITYKAKLEIFAEAVQAEPIDAAQDLWSVVIDASGTIIQKATENS